MDQSVYPSSTDDLAAIRRDLAPQTLRTFQDFGRQVFADGEIDARTKQLIAVAVAHVTQCPYCIGGHVKAALKAGASDKQIMEAIWVAAEMRAGGAFAHSLLALDEIRKQRGA